MKVVDSVLAMQAEAVRAQHEGNRLVLVPTMGSLHEGHLDLVRRGRELGGHVTVSIFVNPTQFAPGEDYDRYPRDLTADLERLESAGGVDVVFAPKPETLYPDGRSGGVWVVVDRMGDHLCGPFRPGHFRGVTTIVAKLFNACRPDVAVFGLKDAQQFYILSAMVRELNFGIEMVGVETVREPDGLAMSSRNRYLKGEAREQATVLSRAVFEARRAMEAGVRDPDQIVRLMQGAFAAAPLVTLEYAELVDSEALQPLRELGPGQTVIAAVAAHVGGARLIDNQIVRIPGA